MNTFLSESMAHGIFFKKYIYFLIHNNLSRVMQSNWQTLSTGDLVDFFGHIISGWCSIVSPAVACSMGGGQQPSPCLGTSHVCAMAELRHF